MPKASVGVWVRIPTTISHICAIVQMATAKNRSAIQYRLTDDGTVDDQTAPKVLLYACQPRGSSEMRSIISTSIANVIRFSAEGPEMLGGLSSLRSHLKSCAESLMGEMSLFGSSLWRLATVNPGINTAYLANANFASTPRLIPVTICSGSRVKSIDERGIDAIDHQRLTQTRSRRFS